MHAAAKGIRPRSQLDTITSERESDSEEEEQPGSALRVHYFPTVNSTNNNRNSTKR
ncbi:unnamed protein product [Polarella glacialis]|uniref:Uncharacterized protein n=1 Tax=Polarella glacialis TaxID=89957 RepID=A0A813HLR6_POLGL|nr:unnamed protein product [Polarella glacialis]